MKLKQGQREQYLLSTQPRLSGSGHGSFVHGELASLSTERVKCTFPFNKSKSRRNLNDVERMCRERSEGSSCSGRTAVQGRITEGRRWWQYGGGIMLDSLVKHQEHTRIGCIAQRRGKEPAKKLRRSGAYDRQYGRRQGTIRMEITLQKRQRSTSVIKVHVVENVRQERGPHTEP